MDRLVKFDLKSYCLVRSMVYDWIRLHCFKCDHSKCRDCSIDVLNRVIVSLEDAEKVDLKGRLVEDGDKDL